MFVFAFFDYSSLLFNTLFSTVNKKRTLHLHPLSALICNNYHYIYFILKQVSLKNGIGCVCGVMFFV